MKHEDLQKLLGGYSTGTLTPQEREALFRGALEDQALFDALANEEALRALLEDGAARAELLTALDERRAPSAWFDWFRRPAVLATAGALAVAVLVLVTVPKPAERVELAKVTMPPPSLRDLPATPSPASIPEKKSAIRRGAGPERVRVAPAAPSPAPPPMLPGSSRPDELEAKAAVPRGPALEGQRDQERDLAALGGERAVLGPAEAGRQERAASGEAVAMNMAERTSAPAPAIAGAAQAGGARQAGERFQAAETAASRTNEARTKIAPPAWRIVAVSGETVSLAADPERALTLGERLAVWRGESRLGELTVTRVSSAGIEARFAGSVPPRPGDTAKPFAPGDSRYNQR